MAVAPGLGVPAAVATFNQQLWAAIAGSWTAAPTGALST